MQENTVKSPVKGVCQGGDVVRIAPQKRLFICALIFFFLAAAIPVPVFAGEEGIVKPNVLNVRKGPGTNYSVLTQVKAGESYRVLDKSGQWAKLLLHNGQEGWTSAEYLNIKTVETKKVKVKSDPVNLRKGPGTGFAKIGQVKAGVTLEVISERNDWFQVHYDKGQAWIAGWLVEGGISSPAEPSRSGNLATVQYVIITGKVVNVRKGPGLNHPVVTKIGLNEKHAILAEQNGWYKLRAGGQEGWVLGELVKVITETTSQPPESTMPPSGEVPAAIIVTGDIVNIRDAASLEAAIVTKVSRGQRLNVISRLGDWYQVRLSDNRIGWIAGWLTQVATAVVPPSFVETEVLSAPVSQGRYFRIFDVGGKANLVLEGWEQNQYKATIDKNAKTLTLELEGGTDKNYEGQLSRLGITKLKIYSSNSKAMITAELNFTPQENLNYDEVRKRTVIQLGTAQVAGLSGKTIVIDPGHASIQPGGWLDPGAVGRKTGLHEKDVNLSIALKLKNLLEQAGAKVIMTHTGSTDLTLAGRAEIANILKADIFVSVHANSSDNGTLSGHSTYFYAPSGHEILGAQRYSRQKLATLVQRELSKAGGRKDAGVLEANFAVLRETKVPSILVETAYLSDVEEERLLGNDGYRQQLAVGIYQGLKLYFE